MRIAKKKSAVVVATIAAVSAATIGAYAYFTASGSANGSADAGTSTAWSVTGSGGTGLPASSGAMTPGGATASLGYRITNAGTGHQGVTTVTVTVAAANGNVLDATTGNEVSGCSASWFVPGTSTFLASDGTTPVTLPVDLAAAGYITGTTVVSMSNVSSSQDACKLAHPRLVVTVG